MMAAFSAAKHGHQVVLLEKNEKLGKKVFITGKGRCNITNACDVEVLFQNVITNPKFLYTSFYTFDNSAVVELLSEYGCPTKTERGERVFPISDHSSDVIAALTRALKAQNVNVRLHTKVAELCVENDMVTGVKLVSGEILNADAVIVCTGGLSYPSTGSTGDGYTFAKAVDMEVVEPKPALVPLECKEDWCKELMGLSLRNVEVTIMDGKKKVFQEFGEMLFTHFGITGPLILSASSHYVKKYYGEKLPITIDLKPALSVEQLDKRVLRDFEGNINKQFKNAVSDLFPSKLVPVMISLSGIHPEKKVNEISREERQQFVHLIKHLPLTITGTRSFAEAIITQGGIKVKEINPSTMESKKVSGLYFAGEVLDLDAVTGGFNLQIAWSTGYLAGASIA